MLLIKQKNYVNDYNPCPKCQCSDCIHKCECGDCKDCGNADTVNCKKYEKNPNAEWGLKLKK